MPDLSVPIGQPIPHRRLARLFLIYGANPHPGIVYEVFAPDTPHILAAHAARTASSDAEAHPKIGCQYSGGCKRSDTITFDLSSLLVGYNRPSDTRYPFLF